MNDLSVRQCLRAGWSGFRSRPWLFIGSYVVLFVASAIADLPHSAAQHFSSHAWGVGFLAFLASTGLSFLISMGKTSFYLKAHDAAGSTTLADLWHPRPFWKFAGATVLAGAATILGLVLLIVPGIILGIMFGFSSYIVIEKHSAPLEALRQSAALTKGNRWKLFLLGLAILGINILGLCALIIGLFVTLPISMLAVVHAYRVLSGTAGQPQAPVPQAI